MNLKTKNKTEKLTKRFTRSGVIKTLAFLSLVLAYAFGIYFRGTDEVELIKKVLPADYKIEKISTDPLVFRAHPVSDPADILYIPVGSSQGYGGPVRVATVVDRSGVIKDVTVISHMETPSWYLRVVDTGFFDRFPGKKVSDPLRAGVDIDTISRATLSSNGFSGAVRAASRVAGNSYLGMDIKDKETSWNFGMKEIVLLVLYLIIFIGVSRKITKLRYVSLAGGLVFVGFYFATPVSLANISSLMLGYYPSIKDKLYWWLLVPGVIAATFLYGRNLYCYWLCPFGAIQEFMSKLTDMNIKPNPRLLRMSKKIAAFFTWLALMVIFISQNPSLASFEPFATLFVLEGVGVQWFILPAVILGSSVIKRFWCRFFCPVGVTLDYTVKGRKKFDSLLEGRKG